MFDRRDFLRTTGAVLGGGSLVGSASAGSNEFDNYELVGQAPVPGVNEIVTQGDWAYATSGGSIVTIDINNPEFPTVAGRAEGDHESDSPDVKVAGDVAALTHDTAGGPGGFSLFDVSSPIDPEFVGYHDTGGGVHNLFLKESPDGRTYAYVDNGGFSDTRMTIVDVTDPANPVTLEGSDVEETADVPDEEKGTNGSWMLREARPDMADAGMSILHDLYVMETDRGNELAYLCFWDAGVVVVDVTVKTRPVAVGHFGAVPYADDTDLSYEEELLKYVGGGEKSNAHYAQPTPDLDYTFVGAETFPGPAAPPGGDTVQANGDHGGVRVFDTREVAPVAEDGVAIYPEADDVADDPRDIETDPMGEDDPVQNPDPDRRNPDNRADMVAYIPAPEGPDDAALTSHNFDVTDEMLFTSWYRGGIRAFDLTTLYYGSDYEEHARHPRRPIEVGTFAADGMAFWTAENVDYEEDPDTIYTLGSDIGKGAVTLKLERGPGGLF